MVDMVTARQIHVFRNQALDDDDVHPLAVELGMLLVHSDLTKTARPHNARLAAFAGKTRETSFQ